MKFLFLTPQLPYPPQQGAALRNWGFIREIARTHTVDVLTFGPAGASLPYVRQTVTVAPPHRSTATRLRELLTTTEPDMARRLWSPEYADALAQQLAAESYDVVQVEGIEMMPYALPYLGKNGVPRWLYDAHNAESDLQLSALRADMRQPRKWPKAVYSAIQSWKLRRYEQHLLPRFDWVCAVSAADGEILQRISGVRPLVIPNGIDTEATAPKRFAPAPVMQTRVGPHLVFTGKMDFRPNIDAITWFADEILPRVRAQGINPTVWVVGQKAEALAARYTDPAFVFTGWVEAVEPYLAGADVVIVPLRMGSGTRLKVLQALSMARPLVGTTLGCAGLGLTDGEHVLLADEAQHFAEAIQQILTAPQQAHIRAQRARDYVAANFDWRILAPRLLEAVRA